MFVENIMAALKLSVLDQSVARSFEAANEAFRETIDVAQFCESLGYERFWISEHHAFPIVAGSAPEILLAALGAATKTIRLGSGGVMLPHYSAYKVAEQFSVLANLYPGRIDLGIGRAPGSDMSTAKALARDGRVHFHEFPEQVESLSHYLWNSAAKPLVSPKPPSDLPLWMLGSSRDSAVLAAERGLPYNLGKFINPDASPSIIKLYRENFRPSELCPEPKVILTISVFCAEQATVAEAQARTFDLNFFRFITGQEQTRFLTPQEAFDIPDTPQFLGFRQRQSQACALGAPDQVKKRVMQLAEAFAADEIMAVSNIHYFDERKASFALLKDIFN